MPIYEFKCTTCGRRFEKLCSMGENGESMRCPNCDAPAPVRVMSSFSAKGVEVAGGGDAGCTTCSSHNCSSCGH